MIENVPNVSYGEEKRIFLLYKDIPSSFAFSVTSYKFADRGNGKHFYFSEISSFKSLSDYYFLSGRFTFTYNDIVYSWRIFLFYPADWTTDDEVLIFIRFSHFLSLISFDAMLSYNN